MHHHMQITAAVILQLMLNEYGLLCLREGRGVGSVYSNKTRMNTDNQTTDTANLLWLSTANSTSASIGIIQGKIVVAIFLAKNGPRGTYSQFCKKKKNH